MPFCSERCKLIDLSRWMSEQHGIPLDPEAQADREQERQFRRQRDDEQS